MGRRVTTTERRLTAFLDFSRAMLEESKKKKSKAGRKPGRTDA